MSERNKRRRHLKEALSILRILTQRRPIERAWGYWQNTRRHVQTKAVFTAWVLAAQHQRQLKTAQQTLCASKEVTLVLSIWTRWRARAGVSSLTRLLNAWKVIGAVRRAIVLRDVALEARAVEHLRRRRLRCVPGGCFIQHPESLTLGKLDTCAPRRDMRISSPELWTQKKST